MSIRAAAGHREAAVAHRRGARPRARVALLALAAVVASGATAAPDAATSATVYVSDANPSWSPDGKRIVFERRRQVVDPRNGECCVVTSSALYVINADGRNPRLIRSGGRNGEPAWSPNGRLIAFSYQRTPTAPRRVYVMRADGRRVRPLRRDSLEQSAPVWAPNGELAFWRGRSSGIGLGAIYVARADGSRFRRIVANVDEGGVSWSPDGKRVLFARNFEIYVASANGTNARRLTRATTRSHYGPAWSPDGRRIAFSSEGGVYVMRADGRAARRITRARSEVQPDTSPAWSPRGRYIAFASYRAAAREARIYRVAAAGGTVKRLTNAP